MEIKTSQVLSGSSGESGNHDGHFRGKAGMDIPFKAKAWLDLRDKQDATSADVKKHRNDIIRIVSELPLKKCTLPEEVRSDMVAFVKEFDVTEAELKNLKILGDEA